MHLGLNASAGAGKVRMKKGKTKSRRIDDRKQPGLSLSATHKDDGRGACCKVTGTLKKKVRRAAPKVFDCRDRRRDDVCRTRESFEIAGVAALHLHLTHLRRKRRVPSRRKSKTKRSM